MQLHFTKMEGLGNDYIYINCFKEQITNPIILSRRLSDRHFGIGADGLILIKPSEVADFAMEMYNADGSRGAMCGNGIRCVGKYVYDYGLTNKTELTIETCAGVRRLKLHLANGTYPEDASAKLLRDCVQNVTVHMGQPDFCATAVGLLDTSKDRYINETLVIDSTLYHISCVSMGNPHCVLFVDDVRVAPVCTLGRIIEHLSIFSNRTNVEFVQVVDASHISMRVWERGSGETFACGTGACAAMVISALLGKTNAEVEVSLLGGKLFTKWNSLDGEVYMTGPASTVFDGVIRI